MLTLSTSGISVFAHSPPQQGKTTAAILSLLSTASLSSPNITNLVLVPSPALAEHYKIEMENLSLGEPQHFQVLYRTGSREQDELQHEKTLCQIKASHFHTLIATPNRLLDYLSTQPNLLSLKNIRQLVIEEADTFEFSNKANCSSLEPLVKYLLSGREDNGPLIQILASSKDSFTKLPKVIKMSQRPLIEVSEASQWNGKIIEVYGDIKSVEKCVEVLKNTWNGKGLVVPPRGMSSAQLQIELGERAVVAMPNEVTGLKIEGLECVYMIGEQKKVDIDKLKWLSSLLVRIRQNK